MFGKSTALIIGLCGCIGVLYAVNDTFPALDITWISCLFFLAGVTYGSYQQIPWAMYPDLMDVTRQKTGEAIEGAFSAVWLLGQKIANALGPFVLSLILGFSGFEEATTGEAIQTQEALNALIWGITLLPATILFVAVLGLIFIYFPLAQRILKQA